MEPITLTMLGVAAVKALIGVTVVSTGVVVLCWVVEQFISNAKVKARIRGVRKFFVKVRKVSWNLAKMIAKQLDGTVMDSEIRSSTEFTDEYWNSLNQGPMQHEVFAY